MYICIYIIYLFIYSQIKNIAYWAASCGGRMTAQILYEMIHKIIMGLNVYCYDSYIERSV